MGKRGRKPVLYDIYANNEYLGRYTQREITEKYGIPQGTVWTLASTERMSLEGYEVLHIVPPYFSRTWEAACELAKKLLKDRKNEKI